MRGQQADPAELRFQDRGVRYGRSLGLGLAVGEAGEQARVLDRGQFPAARRGNDHVVHDQRRFQQPGDRAAVGAVVRNAGELRLTFPPTMPGHGMGTQSTGPGACPAALDR
jgi:hypothetical protein